MPSVSERPYCRSKKGDAKLNTDIRDSVGDPKKGAVNRDEDVRTVQGLLNVQIVKDRRSERFVAVDGRVGQRDTRGDRRIPAPA